ncbi:MAG: hypothetical protein HQL90_00330 [Magnetococcales bacterium]|nr:hypothetical protein [Magnetococcales bacterium]
MPGRGKVIPLKDFLIKGVRHPKTHATPELTGPLPTGWVSAWDYWVEGVRKPAQVPEETIVRLRPPSRKKPLPPEAWLTEEDVLADIQQLYALSIVPLKVEERRQLNQEEVELGEVSPEEGEYRDVRLEEIQEEHLIRIEGIVHWFVDNYFREFESVVEE